VVHFSVRSQNFTLIRFATHSRLTRLIRFASRDQHGNVATVQQDRVQHRNLLAFRRECVPENSKKILGGLKGISAEDAMIMLQIKTRLWI